MEKPAAGVIALASHFGVFVVIDFFESPIAFELFEFAVGCKYPVAAFVVFVNQSFIRYYRDRSAEIMYHSFRDIVVADYIFGWWNLI